MWFSYTAVRRGISVLVADFYEAGIMFDANVGYGYVGDYWSYWPLADNARPNLLFDANNSVGWTP